MKAGWRAAACAAAACVALAAAAAGPSPNQRHASPADGALPSITGAWASTSGAERIIFSANGDFRTCFAGPRGGNAAIGRWKTLSPGRYAVEFTHTASADCNTAPRPIRQHPASIRGQVLLSKGELALYVSGEFPPDLYRPVASGAGH